MLTEQSPERHYVKRYKKRHQIARFEVSNSNQSAAHPLRCLMIDLCT